MSPAADHWHTFMEQQHIVNSSRNSPAVGTSHVLDEGGFNSVPKAARATTEASVHREAMQPTSPPRPPVAAAARLPPEEETLYESLVHAQKEFEWSSSSSSLGLMELHHRDVIHRMIKDDHSRKFIDDMIEPEDDRKPPARPTPANSRTKKFGVPSPPPSPPLGGSSSRHYHHATTTMPQHHAHAPHLQSVMEEKSTLAGYSSGGLNMSAHSVSLYPSLPEVDQIQMPTSSLALLSEGVVRGMEKDPPLPATKVGSPAVERPPEESLENASNYDRPRRASDSNAVLHSLKRPPGQTFETRSRKDTVHSAARNHYPKRPPEEAQDEVYGMAATTDQQRSAHTNCPKRPPEEAKGLPQQLSDNAYAEDMTVGSARATGLSPRNSWPSEEVPKRSPGVPMRSDAAAARHSEQRKYPQRLRREEVGLREKSVPIANRTDGTLEPLAREQQRFQGKREDGMGSYRETAAKVDRFVSENETTKEKTNHFISLPQRLETSTSQDERLARELAEQLEREEAKARAACAVPLSEDEKFAQELAKQLEKEETEAQLEKHRRTLSADERLALELTMKESDEQLALELSKLARDEQLALELAKQDQKRDEELAREVAQQDKSDQDLIRKLKAEDDANDEEVARQLAKQLDLDAAECEASADPGQMRILAQIRREQERRLLEDKSHVEGKSHQEKLPSSPPTPPSRPPPPPPPPPRRSESEVVAAQFRAMHDAATDREQGRNGRRSQTRTGRQAVAVPCETVYDAEVVQDTRRLRERHRTSLEQENNQMRLRHIVHIQEESEPGPRSRGETLNVSRMGTPREHDQVDRHSHPVRPHDASRRPRSRERNSQQQNRHRGSRFQHRELMEAPSTRIASHVAPRTEPPREDECREDSRRHTHEATRSSIGQNVRATPLLQDHLPLPRRPVQATPISNYGATYPDHRSQVVGRTELRGPHVRDRIHQQDRSQNVESGASWNAESDTGRRPPSELIHHVPMEFYTPPPSSEESLLRSRVTPPPPPLEHMPSEGRRQLVRQGQDESHQAISSGQSHLVRCQGCGGRLRAPISYSLVYCPGCHVVSPGRTMQNAQQASSAALYRDSSEEELPMSEGQRWRDFPR